MKRRSVVDTRLQPMISGFMWGLGTSLLVVVALILSRYAPQPATAAQPPLSSGVQSPADRIVVV